MDIDYKIYINLFKNYKYIYDDNICLLMFKDNYYYIYFDVYMNDNNIRNIIKCTYGKENNTIINCKCNYNCKCKCIEKNDKINNNYTKNEKYIKFKDTLLYEKIPLLLNHHLSVILINEHHHVTAIHHPKDKYHQNSFSFCFFPF